MPADPRSRTIEALEPPEIRPFGDSALLVVFGDRIDMALNARVHALAAGLGRIRSDGDARWGVPVPAYSTLLVPYDAELLDEAEAARALRAIAEDSRPGPPTSAPEVVIPVRYGGESGPDLDDVARRTGLTPADVVAVHAAGEYRVFMLGFVPGFAYIGPLAPQLTTPRRPSPRPRVPAGSVAIAGEQTGVYPLTTPGGWNVIGWTALVLWDATRDPPALLLPGARVRFVPVD